MLDVDLPQTPRSAVSLRRAVAADIPAMAVVDGRAFGTTHTEADLDDLRRLFDPDRFLLAHDGDTLVGSTGSFEFDVTLPGGARIPAPGVTWVSVAVTHRRRGILRALMAEQHRGFVADGLAVSLLTASEGGIYGRFGYGVATEHRTVEIDRRGATFRPGLPDPGGVREVGSPELRALAPDLHRRWAAITPGALSRDDAWWDRHLADHTGRNGGTALFHLVHEDGYVSYLREHGPTRTCRIVDMAIATDEAYLALWRTLLAIDLVDVVAWRSMTTAEPLPFLLTDPRQVRTVGLYDGVWARVLDVPSALAARRYAVEIDVVLDVHDPFLDRGGRFRLRGGPDGAECVPGTGSAVGIDITALGSLLFGGAHAGSLARAGLLTTDNPAQLPRLDAAFRADRAPRHGTEF